MNITGYKRKRKSMNIMLSEEKAKKYNDQCQDKILRLEHSLVDCNRRIRKLRDKKKVK